MRKITVASLYKKACSQCSVDMFYKDRSSLQVGIDKNTKCPSCRAKGHSMKRESRDSISLKNRGAGNGMFGKGYMQLGPNNPNYGNPKNYKHSAKTRENISTAKRGKKRPDMSTETNPSKKKENRDKLSLRMRGDRNPSRIYGPWNKGRGIEKLSDFSRYMREVINVTQRNLHLIPGFDKLKRGRAGVKGAYHVDHIIPIRRGFREGISPKEIGAVANLQFIPWEKNQERRELCFKKKKFS